MTKSRQWHIIYYYYGKYTNFQSVKYLRLLLSPCARECGIFFVVNNIVYTTKIMFRCEVTIPNVTQGGALYFLNKEHSYLQDGYSNLLS